MAAPSSTKTPNPPRTHVVLGAGGFAGNALAAELLQHGLPVRLASRSGHRISGADAVRCDLLSPDDTREACRDAEVVYLCAGLPYDRHVWREQWPMVMAHTIDACAHAGARLVFFDNVYMYGYVDGVMTEATPFHPCSDKGELRTAIVMQLLDAMQAGRVEALIARAADVYGPFGRDTCVPNRFVIAPLLAGKPAQWMGDPDRAHSFTYTFDAARAMRLLGADRGAFGRTWHLPTAAPAVTGREFVHLAAQAAGTTPRLRPLAGWMLRMAGLFDRGAFEAHEMLYQSLYDYRFDSSAFCERYGFTPTPYAEGIRATAEWMRAAR